MQAVAKLTTSVQPNEKSMDVELVNGVGSCGVQIVTGDCRSTSHVHVNIGPTLPAVSTA
jgi:H2-forming N5,N10-methylenetetrahydromethanopterin dehydrogenase-like enzyme